MKLSGLIGVVFAVFFYLQSEFVSAEDFSQHLSLSQQTVILLQLSAARVDLHRQKSLPDPDGLRINELESQIRVFEDILADLRKEEVK